MRIAFKYLYFLLLILPLLLAFNNDLKTLVPGEKAPLTDLDMQATDGKTYTLNDLAGEKGLVVIFSCNTCPFVLGSGAKEGWEERYNAIFEQAQNLQLGMVLVNANEAKRPEGGDAMADMIKRASEKAYQMPYVLDKNSQLADAFGARTTPHVFMFDAQFVLVYEGAIDDNVNAADAVKSPYLQWAMENLAHGRAITPSNTPAVGCSIKRKS
jgi:hypothetical protein